MRQLKFPAGIVPEFQDYLKCDWFAFPGAQGVAELLGPPGYIENDSLRTVGGREFYWAYEHEGLRFMITVNEFQPKAMVTANPPDPAAIAAALKLLGLTVALEDPANYSAPIQCKKNIARGLVWVFQAENEPVPTAVFSCKQNADEWIDRHQMNGRLRAYPLDISRSETYCRFSGIPASPHQPPAIIDEVGEMYHYHQGKQV